MPQPGSRPAREGSTCCRASGVTERGPRSVGTEPRMEGPIRRFALVVGIVVTLGLGAVPSAVAADPDVKHFTITESFTDDNFCGTGQAVDT